MSVRYEWMTAGASSAWLTPPGETASDGQNAEEADWAVLEVGHGDSYGAAVQGTRDELIAFLDRARLAVLLGQARVKIENDYSDGHHSEKVVIVEAPDADSYDDLTDWFEQVVWPHTGDGHGEDSDLGSCYTATVLEPAELAGQSSEWVD